MEQQTWFEQCWPTISVMLNTILIPMLVVFVRQLLSKNKENRWVKLALEVITEVIEKAEPSGSPEATPIKDQIAEKASATGQYRQIDTIVDQAKTKNWER
jgi:hypothetical protein